MEVKAADAVRAALSDRALRISVAFRLGELPVP
jgi:hypothetical protein